MTSSPKIPAYAAGALLVAMIAVFMFPALHGGFLLDDDTLLTANPLIRDPAGIWKFWCTTSTPDYFPLTSSFWWIQWRIWGDNPEGYHAVNIALHCLSVILLWRLLLRLNIPGAWWIALIFGIHPVCVRSVAWISELKNMLSMPLFLGALILFVRSEQYAASPAGPLTPNSGGTNSYQTWKFVGKNGQFYIASLLLFALALLSKTSVVIMPFVLILLAWWQRGRVTQSDILKALPFLALSLVLGAVTVWYQYHKSIEPTMVRHDNLAVKAALVGWGVWFYISKLLLPINLAMIYPEWHLNSSDWTIYLPTLALVAVLGIAWWYRKTWGRPIFAGVAYFVLMAMPVLGFFNMAFYRSSYVSDHLQYAPMIGIIALIIGSAATLYDRFPQSARAVLLSLGVLVVLGLGSLTWAQCGLYKDRLTLAEDTLRTNPNSFWAHGEVGYAAQSRGDFATAIDQYKIVLSINPYSYAAYDNLGAIYMAEGNYPLAVQMFTKAVQLKPSIAGFKTNLDQALAKESVTTSGRPAAQSQ